MRRQIEQAQSTIKDLAGELERLKKEGDTLRACIRDDTETEQDAKRKALKVLPLIQVEGDKLKGDNQRKEPMTEQ